MDNEKVLVGLYWNTLVTPLVEVSVSSGVVMGMVRRSVCHRDPVEQTPHCSIFSGLKNHVPVVWQPALGEEINWKLLQSIVQDPLERFIVAILVKNRVSLITTI